MIEVGVVLGLNHEVLRWHQPPGASSGHLPDSRELWLFFAENRDRIIGFAHLHPWNGEAWPSPMDLSTFAAIELGLDKRLEWWVATFTEVGRWSWDGQSLAYEGGPTTDHPPWLDQLRAFSSTTP